MPGALVRMRMVAVVMGCPGKLLEKVMHLVRR